MTLGFYCGRKASNQTNKQTKNRNGPLYMVQLKVLGVPQSNEASKPRHQKEEVTPASKNREINT